MLEFASILAVALAGGVLPLIFRWSHRQYHAALALSSGVFLGAVFLHLLPMVGAIAGFGHAELVFRPMFQGDPLGPATMHDHDGDGVPDHLARTHPSGVPDPGAAVVPRSEALPEGASAALGDAASGTAGGPGVPGHTHGSSAPWLWVLLGVVGVYLVEALLVPGHHHHPHQAGCGDHGHGAEAGPVFTQVRPEGPLGAHAPLAPPAPSATFPPLRGPEGRERQRHGAVGWAALVGLSVHSLTSGVALAAVADDAAIASVMLWAILAHKGFESFSLASVFSMTARDKRQVLALVVAFSFVTPLGLLLGHQVTALFGTGGIAVLTSLAAGTFLYVCIGELLPEVFHHREDVALKVALLGLGVFGMYFVHTIGGA